MKAERGTVCRLFEVQCEVSPQSVMNWGNLQMLVQSRCTIYLEILEHIILPSPDKLHGDGDFLFPAGPSTSQQCQNCYQIFCWPCYYFYYYCAWLGKPTCLTPCESMERCQHLTLQKSWRLQSSLGNLNSATLLWCKNWWMWFRR